MKRETQYSPGFSSLLVISMLMLPVNVILHSLYKARFRGSFSACGEGGKWWSEKVKG